MGYNSFTNPDAILYESAEINGSAYQQLSNLNLVGFSTIEGLEATDHGTLYGNFTFDGTTYLLQLFKDQGKIDLIAQASTTGALPQVINVIAENNSGVTGTVNMAQYVVNDDALIAVCYLSNDNDLAFINLQELQQYDPNLGFASYHLEAFSYIKEFIKSRCRDQLFNPGLINTQNTNGGLGGYSWQNITNWTCDSFRQASMHTALYRIIEQQGVDMESTFFKRSKDSRMIARNLLDKTDVEYQTKYNRVSNKSHSLSCWKLSRSHDAFII